MAALDNFRINDPNFQTTADELANRAYQEARNRGLSELEARYAMKDGPMGLRRELLSVTGGANMRGRVRDYPRDGILAAPFFARNLMPPPAQAAPAALALSNYDPTASYAALDNPDYNRSVGNYASLMTEATPAALAQSPAGPQPRPPLAHPKPHMQSAIANDPLLQLMAGGNKQRVGPNETLNFYNNLDPAAQKQHAARIDGSHLAGLEERDAMGPPPEYGNLDGTVYGTGSDTPVLESADPVDDLQDLYAAQNNAQSNPDRSYRDMSQGAQDARGALASVNTGTSGELPVLASVPDRSGSNSLTNLLSGLSRDGIDFAKAVIENGISVTYNGNEIFATDGQGNTSRVDEETAAKIGAANSGGGEQEQNPPMGMSFNPPVPALTSPSTDTGNGGTGPVLRQPTSNTASNGNAARRMTGGYTGNARGSGLPDMQIGLGERLMRMGAAGLAAGAQGPLAQMGAMSGAYNDVNQANRQAEMGNFKIEEERRQKHADRVARLAAAKSKGMGAETVAAARSASIALDNANDVLKGFDDFDGVTGPFNWFVSGWDSSGFGDAGRANVRLKISKMKVDSTLARIAQTKGAISEKEMQIFESDQPSFYASEDVWREWTTNYIRALKIMNTNLSTGQTPYKNGGGGESTVTIGNMKITAGPAKTAK